ncbi:MAG: DNA/RNA non-specific endonuclease [Alphaproteobacteria bacterium]|nr:DNA/RNA non-specific endonuclease [Alphaproteobacteria bacterium]
MKRSDYLVIWLLLATLTQSVRADQSFSNAQANFVDSVAVNLPKDTPLEKSYVYHLYNIGYEVGYSETLKDPLWVFYVLNGSALPNECLTRPKSAFHVDLRTSARVESKDYIGTHYDRGHMAPSFSIGKFYGREAQLETFLLSNICPQKHISNDGVWNSIERMESSDFAKRFGYIEVVCGPLFSKNPQHFSSGIAIPYAHYKAIERPDGKFIAFIVPQEPTTSQPEDYLCSVAEIEKLSGLTLFPAASKEEKKKKRSSIW